MTDASDVATCNHSELGKPSLRNLHGQVLLLTEDDLILVLTMAAAAMMMLFPGDLEIPIHAGSSCLYCEEACNTAHSDQQLRQQQVSQQASCQPEQ